LERRNTAHPQEWLARIGINTGPVIGSLVGIQKYVYDLFGPGINLAARMEAASSGLSSMMMSSAGSFSTTWRALTVLVRIGRAPNADL
jgi:class 3 adenylate cyclase